MEKKQPVKVVRVGGIKAAVWANETQNGATIHNVSFARTYRIPEEQRTPEDNGYRDSTSFRRSDLLLLARVAEKTHDLLFEEPAAP